MGSEGLGTGGLGRDRAGVLYYLLRFLAWLSTSLYLRHRASGIEHIPREGAFLLAPNHASFLDPVLVGCRVPRPIHFMARETLFRGFLGVLIRRLNTFPVNRGGVSKEAIRSVLGLLEQHQGVLVFPEGTRSADGRLGKIETGVVRIAQLAGVPVVPAYVAGSFRALGRGMVFPRPVRTSVRFGPALRFERGVDPLACAAALDQSLRALAGSEDSAGSLSDRSSMDGAVGLDEERIAKE